MSPQTRNNCIGMDKFRSRQLRATVGPCLSVVSFRNLLGQSRGDGVVVDPQAVARDLYRLGPLLDTGLLKEIPCLSHGYRVLLCLPPPSSHPHPLF